MLHVAFGITLTLCPVYDSSADILLFIDEPIFIKNFLKTQIQWISFLHNPFEIIPNKIIKNVICVFFSVFGVFETDFLTRQFLHDMAKNLKL